MDSFTCFMCEMEFFDTPDEPVELPSKIRIVWGNGVPDKTVEVCEECLTEWFMVGSIVNMGHLGETWSN